MSTHLSELGRSALRYHEAGLNVVPLHSVNGGKCSCGSATCGKPGKHPRIRWRSLQQERLGADRVRSYWERWPDANIGLITGALSGVAILDIDGDEGLASLEEIGIPVNELPATPTVATGGGGLHLYFRMPDDPNEVSTVGGILKNVDIRAEGGLAVLPPSGHASGVPYSWQEGRSLDDLDPADFDFTALGADQRDPVGSGRLRWYERLLAGAPAGSRNASATRLAGRYIGLGLSEAETFLLLRGWNALNDPPLPLPELRRTVRSIAEAEASGGGSEGAEVLERLSEILKVRLVAIRRISGDDPKVHLQFDDGEVTLTTAHLLSPSAFQRAVAEATKVVVRKLGPRTTPTHDQLAQMILRGAEDVDAGEEATGSGEMLLMITDYLDSHNVIPEIAEGSVALRGPFIAEGFVWFGIADLVQRASVRWGTRPSLASTAQTMRVMGLSRQTFPTEGGGTRAVWGIAPDRVPLSLTRGRREEPHLV